MNYWCYYDGSDAVFPLSESQMGIRCDIDYLGECKLGTLTEIKNILSKQEGFLKAFAIEELFDEKQIKYMKEKEIIIGILDAFNTVSQISGTGATKEKQKVLSDLYNKLQADGPECVELYEFVFKIALDKSLATHINSIDISNEEDMSDSVMTFWALLGKLLAVRAVTNELRKEVSDYVNSYPVQYRELLGKVITKKINIGVGTKAVNKALGKQLIYDVVIMKASDDVAVIKKWFENGEDVFAEVKYDGVRGSSEMQVTTSCPVKAIRTYNMTELNIDYMPHITEQLTKLHDVWAKHFKDTHYFFDFEITGKERQSVSGEINKLIKGTVKGPCDENWMINIFDVHPWEIFKTGKSCVPYTMRRRLLEGIRERVYEELPNVTIAKRWKLYSFKELMQLYAYVLEQGEEGLVVKKGGGYYELKRSTSWVKMKAVKECDLQITGWVPGTPGSKRENTIGGFVCASSDRKLIVTVGSGFKDKDLAEIMEKGPDTYIGKIVKVKYNMPISKKDNDIKSLFLPRYQGIRFDKDTANDLEYILNK